ncbi:ABC transporter substrate-binding protein [Nocardioides sp. GY 10127]|uniref:ABC transporter substrate-binding protein n=1 Tax=Nocardioides sp. GY 10127 TaxID=2569762 RepID=UPI0014587E9A|nr:ABC transporter substrate-binding protein [Nocardioides sp. GY 10127]
MRAARTVGALAVTVLVSGGLAACGSSDSTSASSDAGGSYGDCTPVGTFGEYSLDTVTDDTLTIKADLPSTGWFDGDTVEDIDSGYEYCLAADIAYQAGLSSVTLINVSFDQLVSGTLTGYDLSLDEISITDDREKVVDFSDPYYESTIGVMTKADADVTADNLASLKIGVKQGTAAADWVTDTLQPTGDVSVYPGDAEAQAALASGQIDAYLQDTAIELGVAKKSGGTLTVVGQYESGQAYGAMFPKGSSNTAVVNKIIAGLKKDGTLDQLSEDYLGPAFGGDPASIDTWTVQ